MTSKLKWIPTTISPKEAGAYLAIVRYYNGSYGAPGEIDYSKLCDGWNCNDFNDGTYNDKCRMKDLRDSDGSFFHVYAWAEITAPTKEELDALMEEKDV